MEYAVTTDLHQSSSTSWLKETRPWLHIATVGTVVGRTQSRFHGNRQLQQLLLD